MCSGVERQLRVRVVVGNGGQEGARHVAFPQANCGGEQGGGGSGVAGEVVVGGGIESACTGRHGSRCRHGKEARHEKSQSREGRGKKAGLHTGVQGTEECLPPPPEEKGR